MNLRWPYLFIARITVEAKSPLSVGSGRPGELHDVALARDANKLPVIPGASIAGVLRHLHCQRFGEETTADVFGNEDRSSGEDDAGQASRVTISDGAVHDSKNAPVCGLLLDPNRLGDEVLRRLLDEAPGSRDHVRLTHRGTAADKGKFDRAMVPPGTRFTFELSCWSEKKGDGKGIAVSLLGLIEHPAFRLGGATRRGYGRLALSGAAGSEFHLADKERRKQLANLPVSFAPACQGTLLEQIKPSAPPTGDAQEESSRWIQGTVTLKPCDRWRFGAGGPPVSRAAPIPDITPITEEHIAWRASGSTECGGFVRSLVVPASAVKGSVLHRTLFHVHRQTGVFANDRNADEIRRCCENNEVVRRLFGWERGQRSDADPGQAGRVWFDDVYLPLVGDDSANPPMKAITVPHSSLDRFTGGVIRSRLFHEEALSGATLKVPMTILDDGNLHLDERRALRDALADLCSGRLSLGAGGGRGLGYCTGEIDQNLTDWLKEEPA